jgi:hypothetical protein
MATNSPYSQKVINCRGRACAKCGYCRDWYWSSRGDKKTVIYTKRPDAICGASYSYGHLGYGPGCAGCCLHFLRCCFGGCGASLCIHNYYGGDGYGHGSGLALNGFLNGGINHHIDILAGADLDARRRRNNAANVADNASIVADVAGLGLGLGLGVLGVGGVGGGNLFRSAAEVADLADGTLSARVALHRAHHDDGRLCECSDNQQ